MKASPLSLATHIAAVILGVAFIFFGLNFFGKWVSTGPAPDPDSARWHFVQAMILKSEFFTFIKILEIIGGILVIIPLTRNFGLLFLGPVIVNILAFQINFNGFGGIFAPPVIAVSLLGAFLLWQARDKFLGLLNRPNKD